MFVEKRRGNMTVEIKVNGQSVTFEQPTYTHLTKLEQSKIVSQESYDILKGLCKNQQVLNNLPVINFIDVVDRFRAAIFDDDCKILATCPTGHKQKVVYRVPEKEENERLAITVGEGEQALSIVVPSIETYFFRLKMCESQSMKILGVDEDVAKILAILDEQTPIIGLSKLNGLTPKDAMKIRKLADKIIGKIYEIEILDFKCDVCEVDYKLPIHMSTEFWLPVVE